MQGKGEMDQLIQIVKVKSLFCHCVAPEVQLSGL
jgi:hypothetical protein